MPTPEELFFGIVFGMVGMAFAAYGRKNNFYFLLCGLCLIAISFFSFDTLTNILAGSALIIAPFILTYLG